MRRWARRLVVKIVLAFLVSLGGAVIVVFIPGVNAYAVGVVVGVALMVVIDGGRSGFMDEDSTR